MSEIQLYEQCAKDVLSIKNAHRKEAHEIGQVVEKVNSDKRYTYEGKKEWIDALRKQMADLNKSKTDELKKVIDKFINQYQIMPVDEVSDSQTVANVLKVIEMCGAKLTVEALDVAVQPLKNSYSSLKMIFELMKAKNTTLGAVAGANFSIEVMDYLYNLLGANPEIMDYDGVIEKIRAVLDMPELFKAGFADSVATTSQLVNTMAYDAPYAVFELDDNMMKAGKMYEELKLKYPRMFSK